MLAVDVSLLRTSGESHDCSLHLPVDITALHLYWSLAEAKLIRKVQWSIILWFFILPRTIFVYHVMFHLSQLESRSALDFLLHYLNSLGLFFFNCFSLQRPCTCQRRKKRCYCFRPHRNENWLFSRYSTGWKCGLHADWTELTSCVDQELDRNEGETAKRRYFYITLLREPISRYLSEWRHVQRGATWKSSRHWCLGRQATTEELPSCYKGNVQEELFKTRCDGGIEKQRDGW